MLFPPSFKQTSHMVARVVTMVTTLHRGTPDRNHPKCPHFASNIVIFWRTYKNTHTHSSASPGLKDTFRGSTADVRRLRLSLGATQLICLRKLHCIDKSLSVSERLC